MAFLGRVESLANEWLSKTIGIRVNVLKSRGLRTDIAFAKNVVLITADRNDIFPIMFDLDAAHCLAEMAGSIMKL
jgi:hypothetical protein